MNHDRLVSICVPVHNRAPFIERTLDSILADGHPDAEIVVVDDGSVDGSDRIIERWAANHPGAVMRFERRPHQGIPATCNALIDLARGAFLAWLGSDDLLLPGGIAARLRYLESHPRKQAVFADARVIDENDRLIFDSVYGGLRPVDKRRFLSDEGLR